MPDRKPKRRDTPRTSKPRKPASKSKAAPNSTARLIDERIASLQDWRGQTLSEIRRLIHAADPDIVEECKWIKLTNPFGTAVWSHAGIVCTGEVYNQVVKLTFARGAFLEDSQGLFNASLEGSTRRAIDIREGEVIDAKAFKELIRAAVAENLGVNGLKNKQPVKLLSGGNPQIAKADGDAPVQAYIAAMPGWKSGLGRRLDALIVRVIPNVRKAVKWNSPFYGIEGQGWFLTIHCLTKYVKVTFFRGASLKPVPPGFGKDQNARWIDIYEDDQLDEAQLAKWVKQAAALPGWVP